MKHIIKEWLLPAIAIGVIVFICFKVVIAAIDALWYAKYK